MRTISEITRSNILGWLKREGIVWHGKLSELDFLRRIFKNLDSLPSEDPRFKTFPEDYSQHRLANDDWPYDWLYEDRRFNLLKSSEATFLSFLCEMLHPILRMDPGEVIKLLRCFNEHLSLDGWIIAENGRISGRPTFRAVALIGRYTPEKELISIKTRYGFESFLAGWTLRDIEVEFDSANITPSNMPTKATGQRRSLVQSYYLALDLTNPKDVQKLLRVFENVLDKAYETAPETTANLTKLLRKDGWDYVDGKLISISKTQVHPELTREAEKFDSEHLLLQIKRIEDSVEKDPSLAIGSAKELVETCCKTILNERQVPFDESWDLPKLVKSVMKELNLLAANIPHENKGAETIKRLLSNLSCVTQGLAELRNLYGSGHGRGFNLRGLTSRHAKLAAGAASTLTVFLFETHTYRQGK